MQISKNLKYTLLALLRHYTVTLRWTVPISWDFPAHGGRVHRFKLTWQLNLFKNFKSLLNHPSVRSSHLFLTVWSKIETVTIQRDLLQSRGGRAPRFKWTWQINLRKKLKYPTLAFWSHCSVTPRRVVPILCLIVRCRSGNYHEAQGPPSSSRGGGRLHAAHSVSRTRLERHGKPRGLERHGKRIPAQEWIDIYIYIYYYYYY